MFRKTLDEEVKNTGRLLARLMTDHFLRQVEVLARMTKGDLVQGIILMAILSANVRHLTEDPALSKRYAAIDSAVTDEMRIPISIHAIAQSLSMPYETTRRHVNRMIRDGQCVRTSKGVIISAAAVEAMIRDGLVDKGLSNLRRLIITLNRAGYDLRLAEPPQN